MATRSSGKDPRLAEPLSPKVEEKDCLVTTRTRSQSTPAKITNCGYHSLYPVCHATSNASGSNARLELLIQLESLSILCGRYTRISELEYPGLTMPFVRGAIPFGRGPYYRRTVKE